MRLKLLTFVATVFAIPAFALDCEDGMRLFTLFENDTCIPEKAARVVTLNDQIVTLPLIEMGLNVVGSAGRIDAEGNTYLRGGMDTLGVDFSNSDITFVGTYDSLDLELIASLDPDLIIGGTYTDAGAVAQLSNIAPTLIVDNGKLGFLGTLRTFADAAGVSHAFENRLALYKNNVERLGSFIADPEDITVTFTFMFPDGDQLWVYRGDENLKAIGQVSDDLGFTASAGAAALGKAQVSYSAELIQDLDADFIFGFYRQSADATPAAVYAAYENWAPGWCTALAACQEGRFILLPIPTLGSTLTSLELALELIEGHVLAHGYVSNDE